MSYQELTRAVPSGATSERRSLRGAGVHSDFCSPCLPEAIKNEIRPLPGRRLGEVLCERTRIFEQKALERPCEIRLVLESEMGKFGDADETFVSVLEDAAKLPA